MLKTQTNNIFTVLLLTLYFRDRILTKYTVILTLTKPMKILFPLISKPVYFPDSLHCETGASLIEIGQWIC